MNDPSTYLPGDASQQIGRARRRIIIGPPSTEPLIMSQGMKDLNAAILAKAVNAAGLQGGALEIYGT
jgi:hypothetical protein